MNVFFGVSLSTSRVKPLSPTSQRLLEELRAARAVLDQGHRVLQHQIGGLIITELYDKFQVNCSSARFKAV